MEQKQERDYINDCLVNLPKHYKFLADSSMISMANDKCAENIITFYKNLNLENVDIVLLCILKGGAFFLTDLARNLTTKIRNENLPINVSCDFITAKSYSGMVQNDVSVSSDFNVEKLVDKHVILVDELIDNGDTIHAIKNYLLSNGIVNVYSCVAFIKNKPRIIEPDWYGLLVPDVWLIGYGLDDMEKYRELNMSCFINKPEGVEKTSDDLLFEDENYLQEIYKFHNEHNKFVMKTFIINTIKH
ncbi:phosphoribosyl transferase domain protein [Hokovirus HKV1]|uniref:Phosphoribosyl transferase domain protein n=1 Tax=Hokovirus HKV1 TaxID=1977638 RepID=A0A1V0SEQ1_9VIRU|nr:phosphoribosyl transferase domain protein [Hokovirus HKV1]